MKIALLIFAFVAHGQGIEAGFTISHTDPSFSRTMGFRQGETVGIRFEVRDKTSGEFVDGRTPFAWMDLRPSAEPVTAASCKQVVQRMLTAGVLSAPRIELNTYYVLVLNSDASITVVDPRFDYGNARVVKRIPLSGAGEDWALTGGLRPVLFVTLPEAGKVAMIDATTWAPLREIDVGPRAGRVGIQPDGHYLWVAYQGGIAAVDTSSGSVDARFRLDEGPREIAFSPDRPLAFVTNGDGVSIVRTDRLELIRHVRTGPRPVSIAFSSKGRAAYVSDAETGSISVLGDAEAAAPVEIKLDPGLGQIRFPGDGRYGFVLNGPKKLVNVIDTSTNRVVHTVTTEHEPERVTFTSTLAYLRERGSAIVQMIPLDSLGREISLAEFPAGQHALDETALPTPAESIVPVPGENSVMVADPKDRAIYYYSEGMAAPMGMFTNTAHEPRALLVVDRTLKRTAPGVYETSAWLERPGTYTVAFLQDSPQAVNCWNVVVGPDPKLPQSTRRRMKIEALTKEPVPSGAAVTVRFRIRDAETGADQPGAADLSVLVTMASWQQRSVARAAEDGIYELRFAPPRAGTYYLHVQSPSLGLGLDTRPLVLEVVDP